MKTKILFILLAAITAGHCLASVPINDGTLYYTILSGTTNMKVDGLYNSSATAVIIPATMSIGGATYNVTSIGDAAFYGCTGLTSVTIPASVTSIGGEAFDGCTGLKTVDLSQATNLQTIGDYAFNDCTAKFTTTTGSPATAVKYDALTSIGIYAFHHCTGLTSFDISGATKLTSIGNNAFPGCTELTSITIPASVTSIGIYVFCNCSSLTSITIPASVTSIGDAAFYGCSNLTSVYMESTVPPTTLGTDIFASCNTNLKFYINDGTTDKSHISAYIKATSAWKSGKITDSNTVPYFPKTVTAAKVATLYLPYEVDIPSDVTAYYCSGKETGKLMLTSLNGGVIPASTPVVIKSDAKTFNFLSNGGTIAQPSDINSTLLGTFADMTVTANSCYTLGKRNESPNDYGFFLYTGTKIAANTCYVDYGSGNGAKGFGLSFDDESTAINDITNSSSAADVNAPKVIYDLQGRRVNTPQRGSLYIVNGKKVLF